MPKSTYRYCPMCATALIEQEFNQIARNACPSCNYIHFLNPIVVVVVTVEYMGKVLLGKRNIEPAKGCWSFFGGYVELGETLEEAALREVKEEANLEVELGRLIGVYSGRDMAHIIVAYRAEVVNEEQFKQVAAQPDEVSEIALFAWDALPPLAFPVHQQIAQDRQQAVLSNLS